MKSVLKSVLLLLIVALCVSAAQAQSPVYLKGDVPFDFVVGNIVASSGHYNVSTLGSEIELWRGPEGQNFLLKTIPMGAEDGIDTSKLVFHRYGNQYVLAEVWCNGVSHEVTTKPSKLIARGKSFETIAVLMTSRR